MLSKVLGPMLLATNFLIGVGLFGAILLATRWASVGRKLMVASIILLAICGFSPLGKLLLYPLESRFPPWDATRGAPPDGIIVLGGSIDADVSAAHGGAIVRSAADRIIGAAALARRYPNARVIYSGGSANLISNDARKDGERWLLVTSAFHMPRSVGLFRKAGFNVEAYPVDWRVGERGDLFMFSSVALEGLGRTDIAIREWIGLVAYRATGKIDRLLPGPTSE